MEASKLKKLLTDHSAGDGPDNYQELTEKQVNKISNIFELFSRWLDSANETGEEGFIESRVKQLINEITIDNMPNWFIYLLTVPNTTPDFLEDLFEKKVKELSQALSN